MSFDVMAALTETSDALTDSYQVREPIYGWDANRHRVLIREHKTRLPGLITQVGQIVWPTTTNDGDFKPRSIPTSRTPGDGEATACYLDISIAVTRWHMMLTIVLRDDIESSIRQLLGRVAAEDRDTQLALLEDMRGWRHRCEIVTGAVASDPQLQAPCLVCGHRTLRVSRTKLTARCVNRECKARWAETEDPERGIGNIGQLADWIRRWREEREQASAA